MEAARQPQLHEHYPSTTDFLRQDDHDNSNRDLRLPAFLEHLTEQNRSPKRSGRSVLHHHEHFFQRNSKRHSDFPR